MKANLRLAIAIALVAGVAAGGGVIQASHAQSGPPTYVIVEIAAITDPEGFKAVPVKASPASLAQFGGKYIVRSNDITAVEGPAPKRVIVIEFDTLAHANAWRASENTKAFEAIRAKTTTSREFMVGGM